VIFVYSLQIHSLLINCKLNETRVVFMELGGSKLLADSPLTAKLLLVLASTVLVGYNSQGTNDHTVLFHGSEGMPRVLW
jgi:hypothetical protein